MGFGGGREAGSEGTAVLLERLLGGPATTGSGSEACLGVGGLSSESCASWTCLEVSSCVWKLKDRRWITCQQA